MVIQHLSHFFFLIGVILFLGSCASGPQLDDLNRPVLLLKRAAKYASPQGVRRISENGRTFYSGYFPANGDFTSDAKRSRVRAFSKITILGDQRPYRVTFEVIIQRRDGRGYTNVDRSMKLAREIRGSFLDYIDQRPNGRDLIDDFRVF